MESLDPSSVDLVMREPLDEFLQRDPRLKSSEWCAQTEVNAMAKGNMAFDRAVGDVAIWIGKGTRIPVCSPVNQEDD